MWCVIRDTVRLVVEFDGESSPDGLQRSKTQRLCLFVGEHHCNDGAGLLAPRCTWVCRYDGNPTPTGAPQPVYYWGGFPMPGGADLNATTHTITLVLDQDRKARFQGYINVSRGSTGRQCGIAIWIYAIWLPDAYLVVHRIAFGCFLPSLCCGVSHDPGVYALISFCLLFGLYLGLGGLAGGLLFGGGAVRVRGGRSRRPGALPPGPWVSRDTASPLAMEQRRCIPCPATTHVLEPGTSIHQ